MATIHDELDREFAPAWKPQPGDKLVGIVTDLSVREGSTARTRSSRSAATTASSPSMRSTRCCRTSWGGSRRSSATTSGSSTSARTRIRATTATGFAATATSRLTGAASATRTRPPAATCPPTRTACRAEPAMTTSRFEVGAGNGGAASAAPAAGATCSWCERASVGELMVVSARVAKRQLIRPPTYAPACADCAARLKERYAC